MSGSFAKEPYVFREPTNGSHPISSNDIQISCLDVSTDCYQSLLQNIVSFLQGSFAKEPYVFREPAHRSHPISSRKTLQNFWSVFIYAERDLQK